ncbi:MAG: hypothetical protein J6M63_11050 [Pseudobutyrivibrio sp.]|nr:hypothetical protein [Pseudobutyrivibrio sp.]MBP3622055.1 hypothetical protein [Lachnospiraceae bacterium]
MTMIKKDGHWVTVAGGQRMWVGTKAQLDAALAAGELEDGTAVMVTDDYHDTNDNVITGAITAANGFIPNEPQTSLTRCGNFVTLTVSGNTDYMNNANGFSHEANNENLFAIVPEGFRPAGVICAAGNCHCSSDGDGALTALCQVNPDGTVVGCGPTNPTGQIGWVWFTVTYFTTDVWPE